MGTAGCGGGEGLACANLWVVRRPAGVIVVATGHLLVHGFDVSETRVGSQVGLAAWPPQHTDGHSSDDPASRLTAQSVLPSDDTLAPSPPSAAPSIHVPTMRHSTVSIVGRPNAEIDGQSAARDILGTLLPALIHGHRGGMVCGGDIPCDVACQRLVRLGSCCLVPSVVNQDDLRPLFRKMSTRNSIWIVWSCCDATDNAKHVVA